MDSTLRPKATAKRMKARIQSTKSDKISSKPCFTPKTRITQIPKAAPKPSAKHSVHPDSDLDDSVSLSRSQFRNPYLSGVSLNWAKIQEIDRRIYLLQKGAPAHGSTLPWDWTHNVVKKFLTDEGVDTLSGLSCRDNTEILKSRYESVRLGLQTFYDSKPEPVDKRSWTLYKFEEFDVYDQKPGARYWRHQIDSVLGGTRTSSDFSTTVQASETAESMIGNENQRKLGNLSEKQDNSEAKTPTSMPDVTNSGESHNQSCFKRPTALEIDASRTIVVHLENDCEKSVTTESEEALVERLRGERVPSVFMSEASFEELLLPLEQYLTDEFEHEEITADSVSDNSEGSGAAEPGLAAQPARTLDGVSSDISEAIASNLNTSSYVGLAQSVQMETTTLGVTVGSDVGWDGPPTHKVETKARKRKSRTDSTVAVHEDLPGRTPLVKKIVAMNPASPGTDIPKENLEDDGSVEHSSQVEIGMPRVRRYYEAVRARDDGRVRRVMSATDATPQHRSQARGSRSSSSAASSRTLR